MRSFLFALYMLVAVGASAQMTKITTAESKLYAQLGEKMDAAMTLARKGDAAVTSAVLLFSPKDGVEMPHTCVLYDVKAKGLQNEIRSFYVVRVADDVAFAVWRLGTVVWVINPVKLGMVGKDLVLTGWDPKVMARIGALSDLEEWFQPSDDGTIMTVGPVSKARVAERSADSAGAP